MAKLGTKKNTVRWRTTPTDWYLLSIFHIIHIMLHYCYPSDKPIKNNNNKNIPTGPGAINWLIFYNWQPHTQTQTPSLPPFILPFMPDSRGALVDPNVQRHAAILFRLNIDLHCPVCHPHFTSIFPKLVCSFWTRKKRGQPDRCGWMSGRSCADE